MSLLSVARNVAKNVGIAIPDAVAGGDDPDAIKLREFINETGQELARRVDWRGLRKEHPLIGTGVAAPYSLPDDFSRVVAGNAVMVNGSRVRGSLTDDEWNSLTPVEGTPRYYFKGAMLIGFYPYPAEAEQISITYVSTQWTAQGKDVLVSDDDTSLIPEALLEMGATWRHKRQFAADYQDYMAEYEAALSDLAQFDGGVREP